MPELETRTLTEIPIWSTGKYNGDEYTESDLDSMVQAYRELREVHEPPLVAGHSPEQTLIQKDGWPALGWVKDVRRNGSTLVADIANVPAKIADLISAGAYRKVSPEIFWNYKHGDRNYSRMLWRVALLGADVPANSLVGFASRAYVGSEGVDLHVYDDTTAIIEAQEEQINEGEIAMSEELKTRNAQLEKEVAELRAAAADRGELATKVERYKKTADELASRLAEQDRRIYAERVKGVIQKHAVDESGKGSLLPASVPFLYALALDDSKEEGVKTYNHDLGDGRSEAVRYSDRAELIDSFLKTLNPLDLKGRTTFRTSNLKEYAGKTKDELIEQFAQEREQELTKSGQKVDATDVFAFAHRRYAQEVSNG